MSDFDQMSYIDGSLMEKSLCELAEQLVPQSLSSHDWNVHRLTGYLPEGAEQIAASIVDLSSNRLGVYRQDLIPGMYSNERSTLESTESETVPDDGTPVYYDQAERNFQVLGKQVSNTEQEFWSLTVIRISAYLVTDSEAIEIDGSVIWYIELDETVDAGNQTTKHIRQSLMVPSKKGETYVSNYLIRATWKSEPLTEHKAKLRLAYLLTAQN